MPSNLGVWQLEGRLRMAANLNTLKETYSVLLLSLITACSSAYKFSEPFGLKPIAES